LLAATLFPLALALAIDAELTDGMIVGGWY
jgi:hypothetical protein